jgi:hypothetical protein
MKTRMFHAAIWTRPDIRFQIAIQKTALFTTRLPMNLRYLRYQTSAMARLKAVMSKQSLWLTAHIFEDVRHSTGSVC